MKFTSRREFFKSLTALGMFLFTTQTLYAKGSKERFMYQETPKDGQKCKDCIHFMPKTNRCKVVEGSIAPQGWCSLYNEGQG